MVQPDISVIHSLALLFIGVYMFHASLTTRRVEGLVNQITKKTTFIADTSIPLFFALIVVICAFMSLAFSAMTIPIP